jgi:hypothetical protein
LDLQDVASESSGANGAEDVQSKNVRATWFEVEPGLTSQLTFPTTDLDDESIPRLPLTKAMAQ